MTTTTQGEHAQPEALRGAPPSSYSQEDHAFYTFWYGHMLNELMQPPLAGVSHSTARYIWDAAIANVAAQPAAPQGGAYVENPAEIEHVAGDVSKNRAESNMTGGAYADAHGAIMDAAYNFRDAHISGSMKEKRSAHAALESAVTHALRASHGQALAGATLDVFGLQWPGEDRINLSTLFDTEEEALEYRDNLCDTPGILVVRLSAQPTHTAQPAPAADLHPKTADLVQRFAAALVEKLAAAQKKYGYSDGWASDDWMDECRQKLLEHVAKGDPRDVAAYCAFLWHHGASTAPAAGAVAGPDGMQDLHDLLYKAQRTTGDVQSAAITQARVLLSKLMAPRQNQRVYGPYDCAFMGAGVWAGIVDELPPELVGQKVYVTAAAPTPAAQGDAEDAARYRWLRVQDNEDFEFAVVKNPHFDVFESPEALDAAIDAERAALAQKEAPHGN